MGSIVLTRITNLDTVAIRRSSIASDSLGKSRTMLAAVGSVSQSIHERHASLATFLHREPGDHRDTWSDFLRRHAATLWQCDFAAKRMWTVKGMVDLYFLVFIHIDSRRVWVSACTAHPTGEWTAQQARNFDMFLQEEHLPCTIVQRDRDSKYMQAFDEVFIGNGRTVKLTPVRSPNLQAFVERVIQTLKHEVLNGFCVVSERHLDHILRIGADWYNRRLGHTSRDHLPPIRDGDQPPTADLCKQKLVCHTELGGHLKSYRAAA